VTQDHNNPGVAFWATVMVSGMLVLTAGYPLSVGPVAWLKHHGFISEETWVWAVGFYEPCLWVPWPYDDLFFKYINLWR
jgi:hypothetical protein